MHIHAAMPVAAITGISNAGISYRWFSQNGENKHIGNIAWETVKRVTVFKRDFFLYDLICLQIETDDDSFEFDEEDPKWVKLVTTLPNYLSECMQWIDWFTKVSLPAFETNELLIFKI